jgi:hypothetical protein
VKTWEFEGRTYREGDPVPEGAVFMVYWDRLVHNPPTAEERFVEGDSSECGHDGPLYMTFAQEGGDCALCESCLVGDTLLEFYTALFGWVDW